MRMADVMEMQAGAEPVNSTAYSAPNTRKTAPPPSALSKHERAVSLG